MRSRLRVLAVAGAFVSTLLAAGCSGDDPGDGGNGSGTGGVTATKEPQEAKPSDTTGPIKDAALAAGSVTVTRTSSAGGADAAVTHEEIEVELTEPLSGRILHVGDEIWTLTVVDGVGYLKDQSEKKSTNRWTKLTDTEMQKRVATATLDGLLGILDTAAKVEKTESATIRGATATCHALTLGPARGTAAGPAPQTARICVDGDNRPVELVVTADDVVATSVFTGWGAAVEAMPPPPNLVD